MSESISTNRSRYPRVLVITADGISADWLLGTSEINHDSPGAIRLKHSVLRTVLPAKVDDHDVWSILEILITGPRFLIVFARATVQSHSANLRKRRIGRSS